MRNSGGRMSDTAKIERELGSISSDIKNMAEDRKEDRSAINVIRDDIAALRSDIKEMSGDVRNLHQAVQSSSHTISQISTERCGERLDALELACAGRDVRLSALETDMIFYKRVFGGTWGISLRLVAGIAAIATIVHLWSGK